MGDPVSMPNDSSNFAIQFPVAHERVSLARLDHFGTYA
jgi:hypothetical protein